MRITLKTVYYIISNMNANEIQVNRNARGTTRNKHKKRPRMNI